MTKSTTDKLKCQIHHTKYKLVILKAKREFVNDEFDRAGNDTRKLFNLCNQFTTTASNTPPVKTEVKAQVLSDFFIDKVAKICSSITTPPSDIPFANTTRLAQTNPTTGSLWENFSIPTAQAVLDKISGLSDSTSPLDILPIKVFKQLAPWLICDIHHLISLSLVLGELPPNWKRAAVTPLLKKAEADPSDPASYRPISQLSVWARLAESCTSEPFRSHLESINCLHDRQVGFRPGRSTEDAILEMREGALGSLDAGHSPITVLLDLSAAFDTVSHNLLIQRLAESGGIGGTVLRWFTSFLSERTQRVKFGGEWSSSCPLTTGVPQGSSLSPSLFNLYLAPLASLIEKEVDKFVLYADDIQLQVVSCNLNADPSRLANCISSIANWMASNQLALNASKTELLFQNPNPDPLLWPWSWPSDMVFPGSSLEARNLGVHIDPSFQVHPHVEKVARKCHFILWKLSRFVKLLDFRRRKLLLDALVMSHIHYCSSVFAEIPGALLARLQGVQNRAIRLICNLRKFDHLSEARAQVGWMPLKTLFNLRLAIRAWKIIHTKCPTFVTNWLPKRTQTRSLRYHNPFHIVIPKKVKQGGRMMGFLLPKLWASLPLYIQECKSLKQFKMEVTAFWK